MGDRLKAYQKQRKYDNKTSYEIVVVPPSKEVKSYEPTATDRSAVTAMVTIGTPRAVMAEYLGITPEVLHAKFERELKFGKLMQNTSISNTIYQRALRGDTGALIFWCKTQLGWKETYVHEHVMPTIIMQAVDGTVLDEIAPPPIVDADYKDITP